MASFSETVGAALSRLAQWLGLAPSQASQSAKMRRKLDEARAANEDRLQALKDRIGDLERQALRKKNEFDAARGESQRIVGREIERVFRDLDRLRGQERILAANIDRIGLAQAKLDELIAAREQGVDEGVLDDLALDLQEAVDDLRQADRVARDLDKVEYTPQETQTHAAERRMAEVEGEAETKVELPPETQKRLKELAGDDV